jgi:hypothetical protein
MYDFFGWISAPTHETVVFTDVKVLFLMNAEEDWSEKEVKEGLEESARESLEFTKWTVLRVEIVGSVEEARRFVEEL